MGFSVSESAVHRIMSRCEPPMIRSWRPHAVAALAAVLATATACQLLGPTGAVTGEVRFARETELPEDATVTVMLLDTTLADASSVELGRDVIENAGRLPVSFRVEYDRDQVSDHNEYSLRADVRHGDVLLYVTDTIHPVLTRGAPGNSDVMVVSTNPLDTCINPLPGQIHSEMTDEELPRDALLHVRLINVTDPEARLVVTETTLRDLSRFPITFELPFEGVQISRHHRYELEADIVVGDETLYYIPEGEWRRLRLPHCPNSDLQIVNSVFPVGEFPERVVPRPASCPRGYDGIMIVPNDSSMLTDVNRPTCLKAA